jgi:hypothetical protein
MLFERSLWQIFMVDVIEEERKEKEISFII